MPHQNTKQQNGNDGHSVENNHTAETQGSAKILVGRVEVIIGRFKAEAKDGTIRYLKIGDPIYEGETVYGDNPGDYPIEGTLLHVQLNNGQTVAITEAGSLFFDIKIIGKDFTFIDSTPSPMHEFDNSTHRGDDNNHPKSSFYYQKSLAGRTNEEKSDSTNFFRNTDLIEEDDSLAQASDTAQDPLLPDHQNSVPDNKLPIVENTAIVATEEGKPVSLGIFISKDYDSDALTIKIDRVPTVGKIIKKDGTVLQAGDEINVNEARDLMFVPPQDYEPGTPVGDFVYQLTNGINNAEGMTEITVLPVNDPPIIDLDRDDSSGALDNNYQTTWTEGTPIAIADIDTSITDTDNANLQQAIIILTNPQAHDFLDLSGVDAKFNATTTTTGDQITATLTGDFTKADYEAAIKTIQFNNTSDDPDTAQRIINVTVTDDADNSNTATTIITVTDVNDAPEISVAAGDSATGSVTEDGIPNTATGILTVSDTDSDDTATWSVTGNGICGTMTMNASSGQWTYTLDNSLPTTQSLAEGENVTDTFTATVMDSSGATDTETLTITVTGVNDAPEISVAAGDRATGSVTELVDGHADENIGNLTDSGTLTFTDPDLADEHTVTVTSAAGALGSLHANITDIATDDGTGQITWNYTVPDSALDSIPVREATTETFIVTVNDGNGGTDTQEITITLNGSNDVPTLQPDTGEVSKIQPVTTGNVLTNDTDVDGDSLTVIGVNGAAPGNTVTTRYGTIVLSEDGVWTYRANTANPAVSGLNDSQTLTDTITCTVDDSHGGTTTTTLTITINGYTPPPPPEPDHPPVITGGNTTGSVTELPDGHADENTGNLTSTGLLSFADENLTDSHTVSVTEDNAGYLGTLTAFVSDDSTWNGTGDVTWNYTVPDSALDSMAVGETLTQIYTVTVNDGNGGTDTQNVTITLNGVNDAPVISIDAGDSASGGVTEINDNAAGENVNDLTSTGTLSFADMDFTDSHTVSITEDNTGYIGTLTASVSDDSTGDGTGDVTWNYTVNDSLLDSLGLNETLTQTYTVTVDDSNGGTDTQNVTITLTGSNDAPIIDLDGDNSSSATGSNYQTTWIEGTPIAIADIDTGVTDVDDANLQKAVIVLTNPKASDLLDVSGVDAKFGVTTSTAGGKITVTLTGDYTKADYEAAIEAIQFNNISDHPDITDRIVNVTVTDDEDNSNTTTTTISIDAVNDTPTGTDATFSGDKDDSPDAAGFGDTDDSATSIQVVLSGTDPDSTINGFKITDLPDHGSLYQDAGLTTVVNVNDEIASVGDLTLYYVPEWSYANSSKEFGPHWYTPATDNDTFNFKPIDSDTDDGVNSDAGTEATITINIDDVPYAMDSSDVSVTEENVAENLGHSVSGNVLTDGASFTTGEDYVTMKAGNTTVTLHQIQFTDDSNNYNVLVNVDSGVDKGGNNYEFTADFGTLLINKVTGDWTFTPKGNLDHSSVNGSDLKFSFTYTLIDGDGDISNVAEQGIFIRDGGKPVINSTTDATVYEKNLTDGSDPDAALLVKTGTINITHDTDQIDVTFDSVQPELDLLIDDNGGTEDSFSSDGNRISYELRDGGHTLAAMAGGEDVFTVELTDPTDTGAGVGYTFTLLKNLDHEDDVIARPHEIDLTFNIDVKDHDHTLDTDSGTFVVTVVDDTPGDTDITLDEDTSLNFNTNSNATSGNTSIVVGQEPSFGAAVVQADGTITYTPDANFSGEDTFQYQTTVDGVTSTYRINATVNPISDAPHWDPAISVTTQEDTQVALGFTLPTVTDATDQDAGSNHDSPEQLGYITLEDVPSGAAIYLADGTTTVFTGDGDPRWFYITDFADHHADLDPVNDTDNNGNAPIQLTTAQFQGLKLLPPTNDNNDIELTLSVTEYEVDHTGELIPGVAGETSTQDVHVEVTAVADGLTINPANTSGTANAPVSINLNPGMLDSDGSETATVTFAGFGVGEDISFNAGTSSYDWDTDTYTITGIQHDQLGTLSFTTEYNAEFTGE